MEEPRRGQVYRNFKGENRLYDIVCVSISCDNPEEKVVIYRSLYDSEEHPAGTTFHRSLEGFIEFKEINGEKVKRFTRVR